MSFLPKSIVGIIGLATGALFTVLLILKFVASPPVSTFTIFGGLIFSLVATLIAWLRKDRAWSYFIFVAPAGLFATLWSLGELVFPN